MLRCSLRGYVRVCVCVAIYRVLLRCLRGVDVCMEVCFGMFVLIRGTYKGRFSGVCGAFVCVCWGIEAGF